MAEPLLHLRLAAEAGAARELRRAVEGLLRRLGAGETQGRGLLLAVSELVTNITRHARPPASEVALTVAAEGALWRLELWDDGGPFPDLRQRLAAAPLQLEVRESGMGLALVAALVAAPAGDREEAVDYRCDAAGNHLTLRLPAPFDPRPRVAVVDDEPVIRALVAEYLGDDYRCLPFADAAAALTGIAGGGFDLVISDIGMPGMDGLGLRRALAERPAGGALPFIFLTAHGEEETRARAGELGIDDYLLKPVRKERLREVVARVLRRVRGLREALGERLDRAVTAALWEVLPERIDGWRLALGRRTAAAGGGDFLHRRGAELLLGDVMGHGEAAKFFAHAYAGYLRGVLGNRAESPGPGGLLAALSDTVAADALLGASLLTAVAVRLEPGRLRLAAAGHPPPLRIGPRGGEALAVSGALPGLIPGSRYREVEVSLAPGERLLLYSDGLFEAVAGEAARQALREALLTTLGETLGQPVDRAAERVMACFDRLTGDRPRDDATLLLIEPE